MPRFRVRSQLRRVMLILAIAAGSVMVARRVVSDLWKPFGRAHLSQVTG